MYYYLYSTDNGETLSCGTFEPHSLIQVIKHCIEDMKSWPWNKNPYYRIQYSNNTSIYNIGFITNKGWERCVYSLYNVLEDECDKDRGWVCPLPESINTYIPSKINWQKASYHWNPDITPKKEYIWEMYRWVRRERISRNLAKAKKKIF